MDFLIIDGQVIPVTSGSFKELAHEQGGSESRSYAGTLRSTVRWEKRAWTFTTDLMEQADIETLRTATALGRPVAITGTALAVTARVTVGEITTINAESSDNNHWVVTADVSMREV